MRSLAAAVALALAVVPAAGCARRAAPPPAPAADTTTVLVAAAPAAREAPPDSTRGELREGRFWSPSLGAWKRYRAWLPPAYGRDTAARYPVAFYLHGLWGSETDWSDKGALGRTLDSLVAAGMPPLVVVMPDGDDSWYTTTNLLLDAAACRRTQRAEPAETYCVPWGRYDEYVARDLVTHVDTTFRTRAGRAHRAVAGLSMGGYGAVTLALNYPDVFAAAASHSGILSPLYDGPAPFVAPPRWITSSERLREKWRRFWFSLGPAFGSDTAAWWARDPARLARRTRDAAAHGGTVMPALWFDAGTGDALAIDENRAFHHELATLGVPHEWHERAGAHDWTYWRTNAPLSLRWIVGVIGP